jgi:hypothetical protein
MGLDLVELIDELERRFKCRIDNTDYHSTKPRHGRPVIIAGDLFDHIAITARPVCQNCQYDLRQLGDRGSCPECGVPFTREPITWEGYCEALRKVLFVEADEVKRGTDLIADLGMS